MGKVEPLAQITRSAWSDELADSVRRETSPTRAVQSWTSSEKG